VTGRSNSRSGSRVALMRARLPRSYEGDAAGNRNRSHRLRDEVRSLPWTSRRACVDDLKHVAARDSSQLRENERAAGQ
jgi:hypothetical protein